MKIIDRYIAAIFLKMFVSAFLILLTLFITITFFDLIDDFVAHDAPRDLVIKFFIMKIPEAALNMAPISVLIGAILAFSVISRTGEVVILLSAGMSVWRIAAPVIFLSAAIAGANFANGEYVLPDAWRSAHDIYNVKIKHRTDLNIAKQDKIWIHSTDGSIWNINFLNLKNKTLNDVMIMEYTADKTSFKRILKARVATPENGKWKLQDVMVKTFDQNGGFAEEYLPVKELESDISIADLSEAEKKPQEMNFKELRGYVEKIHNAGYDTTIYLVDMYMKITFPLACVVMAFIAIPFSIRTGRASSTLAGVTTGIMLAFTFWFLLSMGVSMGYGGKVSPILATILPHTIFMAYAVYKIENMFRKDS